jgi:hypothetical protein
MRCIENPLPFLDRASVPAGVLFAIAFCATRLFRAQNSPGDVQGDEKTGLPGRLRRGKPIINVPTLLPAK